MMYEGQEVFVDIGPYGGVNYKVTEIIMDKSSKGKKLTTLEKFILSEGAMRMGGEGAPLSPQETSIDPVLIGLYSTLEQRHESQLIESVKSRANLLKILGFDFGSITTGLDSGINTDQIVTSIDDFINIESRRQLKLRFSNDLKIHELLNIKLFEDGSSSLEFVFLDKLIEKSTNSFERLYYRICKAIMEVFADPQRRVKANYIYAKFGGADSLVINSLERPYQVTKVSLLMGMSNQYFSIRLTSAQDDTVRNLINFESLGRKIQPSLEQALGKEASAEIINKYLEEQGRRFLLLYSLYSMVTKKLNTKSRAILFGKKAGQYYTMQEFSEILFGKKKVVSGLLETPNPKVKDINTMWTLEYLATQTKPRPRLGFNPDKETLKFIREEAQKIIHKAITDQMGEGMNLLAVKMIFDSLRALSENGDFYDIPRLSEQIGRDRNRRYLTNKVFGPNRNPADSAVTALLELLIREGINEEHEAYKSANLFLQTRGLKYLDFDFYARKFRGLSGPKVSDRSILSPSEVDMAKTIVWGITGGRSWLTGELINYDKTKLHHILHNPNNNDLTLYGLDHENKFSYFAAVTGDENSGILEGKNKKVLENQLLFMWEQFKAGNFAEATKYWDDDLRAEFIMQRQSMNYLDYWLKST